MLYASSSTVLYALLLHKFVAADSPAKEAASSRTSNDTIAYLRDVAEAHNLHVTIGAAGNENYFDDDDYVSTLANNYNLITAENSCKFQSTSPSNGEYDWAACDKIADFATIHNMQFRQHNLGAWGNQIPNWVTNGNYNGTELLDILTTQIDAVIERYDDRAIGYDVVNEAITDDGSVDDIFKENLWYPAIPDYVDQAFIAAKRAKGDSDSLLFYNDYNVCADEGGSKTKSDRMFTMVKSMVDRGIPIDGVGFQMHINTDYSNSIQSNIHRYCDLGLVVHITELDIRCKESEGCTYDGATEQKQADLYAKLLGECLAESCCTNFETWGFTDKHSWENTADELTYPLPFDDKYEAKIVVEKLIEEMQK